MNEIKKIINYSNFYSIDYVWKKINEDKPIIYQSTNIKIENDKLTVFVSDNTIMDSLITFKDKFLEDIKKELPEINILNIEKSKKEIKKEKGRKKEKENKEFKIIDKKNLLKIYEDTVKKYESIEDENIRKICIAYASQSNINKYELEKKGAKICNTCKEHFIPVKNEKECILCVNRAYKKELEYAKSKIYKNSSLTPKYAKEIYGISEKSYEFARNEILDEILKSIYCKINEIIGKDNKDEIELDEELDKFARYYTYSEDEEVLNLFKVKSKIRIKKNIKSIYEKEVEIY